MSAYLVSTVLNHFKVLSDVDEKVLINLIRKFGTEFRQALIYDRVNEELRIFCANHTIDEVKTQH